MSIIWSNYVAVAISVFFQRCKFSCSYVLWRRPLTEEAKGLNPNTNNAYVKGEVAGPEDIDVEVSDASDSDEET